MSIYRVAVTVAGLVILEYLGKFFSDSYEIRMCQLGRQLVTSMLVGKSCRKAKRDRKEVQQ